MLKNILLLTLVSLFSVGLMGQTTDLLFSEYVEGSSSNKYLEIYNGTGTTVDLSVYTVKLYANGATTPNNTETLSGTLNTGEVLVLANSGATIYGGTKQNSSVCNYNGNDALTLEKNGTEIDVIGVVGSSAYFGEDETLRRNVSVCSPTTTFDKSGEWTSFPQDNIDDLGSHTTSCSSSCPLSITSTDASCDNETTGTDTYTASYDFVGGGQGAGTYTVTSDVGTVDLTNGDPGTDAMGTIQVTGINEGTDVTLTISDGVDCNLMETVSSPICESSAIVITEIMPSPDKVFHNLGEWFELYNTSSSLVDLSGWTIEDLGSDSYTIPAGVTVAGNSYIVFARSTDFSSNGGVYAEAEFTGFLSNNDELVIKDAEGNIIDEIDWASNAFPFSNGQSASLDPSKYDPNENDDPANWFATPKNYNDMDQGSPNEKNEMTLPSIYTETTEGCYTISNSPISTGNGDWLRLDDNSGNIVAEVNDMETNLSSINAEVHFNTGAIRVSDNGVPYLDRSVFLTNGNSEGPALVRLYITQAEYADLANSGESGAPTNIDEMNMTRESSTNICESAFSGSGDLIFVDAIPYGSDWILQFETPGFSSFYPTPGSNPLPVEWLSFTAEKTKTGVELSWKVTEEVNVDKYIVERSSGAGNWMPIGTISSNDRLRVSSYKFTDRQPLTASAYYRIQEVDYDGYTDYSEIRFVLFNSEKLNLVNTLAENTLYFNRSFKGQYEILSIDGRRVKADSHSGNQIRITELNHGIYILKVKEGMTVNTYKFTK